MYELKEELNIENMIYEIRGKQVMFNSDVARLYNVETKVLNQVIKSIFKVTFCDLEQK